MFEPMIAFTFSWPHQPFLTEAIAVPIIFIVLVAFGRLLKQRYKVRLGAMFRLFVAVVSFYLPITFSPDPLPWFPEASRHLGAAALFLGTFFLLALIRRFFWEGWFEKRRQTRAPKFVSQLISLFLLIVALLFILGGVYGQSIQGAVFGSTVVLGIIGFAMQDLLGNIISGIALEMGKPFRVGDWLIIDGQHVEVIEVNWRSTRLRTNDDVYLDIPNKTIAGATLRNLTSPSRPHAIRMQVRFEYQVPPNQVRDIIQRATAEVRGVLTSPPVKVFLKEFGDSGILYEIKFWMDDQTRYNDIMDAIRTNVWYAAQRANLRIPFPIRTLQIEKPQARQTDNLAIAAQSARKHPFLQLLDETQMQKLLTRARYERFGRDERIIAQGSQGHSMFILLQGEADVFIKAGQADALVATLRAGDYCGEMSLLTGEPRSATVVARTDCEAWEIDKNTLGEILQENQTLVQRLGEILAQRRMVSEDLVANPPSPQEASRKQKEYTDGFLKKLYSFFDL